MTAAAAMIGGRGRALSGRILVMLIIAAAAIAYVFALVLFAQGGAAHPGLIEASMSDHDVLVILAELGWPPQAYVTGRLLLDLVWAISSYVAVGFILVHRQADGYALYLGASLALVATFGGTAPAIIGSSYPQFHWLCNAIVALSWCNFLVLLYLFPDGRLAPRWTWVFVIGWGGFAVVFLVPGALDIPAVSISASVVAATFLVAGVASQVYRYRRVSGPVGRQQTKWVLLALTLLVADLLVVVATPPGWLSSLGGTDGFLIDLAFSMSGSLVFTLLAVSIAVAIVRYKLFVVDLVVRRVLLYGILSLLVIVVYVLIVGGLGSLLSWSGSLLPFFATAVIAITVQPVHTRLRRLIDRLAFGRRNEPWSVLSGFARQFGSAAPPRQILEQLAGSIRTSLALAGVTITTTAVPLRISVGTSGGDTTETFPLRYDDEVTGEIIVLPRSGETLRETDRATLAAIASQTAIILQAAQSTIDVRASRERLVVAREEERRRLSRDLHDGLGPTLSSLFQRISVADRLIDTDVSASHELLAGARAQILNSISDLRGLVESLRPSVLDQLGLTAALRGAWESQDGGGLTVLIDEVALPPLSAAAEVAVYRIAMEGITNAVRHSGATYCRIVLDEDSGGGELLLTIVDDGVGYSGRRVAGMGIRSMAERAEELGGEFEIRAATTGGTVVTLRMPALKATQ